MDQLYVTPLVFNDSEARVRDRPSERADCIMRAADGLCAIEVSETTSAVASYLDLVTASEEMAEVCVEYSDAPEGSIATNIENRVLRAQLVATVDITTRNKETAAWYDIWAATVAIGGMCVRQGRGGTASWLGTYQQLLQKQRN
ncbi:MAG: hypothetical protein Q9222_005982 [Ikaeria aurantiellina]